MRTERGYIIPPWILYRLKGGQTHAFSSPLFYKASMSRGYLIVALDGYKYYMLKVGKKKRHRSVYSNSKAPVYN